MRVLPVGRAEGLTVVVGVVGVVGVPSAPGGRPGMPASVGAGAAVLREVPAGSFRKMLMPRSSSGEAVSSRRASWRRNSTASLSVVWRNSMLG